MEVLRFAPERIEWMNEEWADKLRIEGEDRAEFDALIQRAKACADPAALLTLSRAFDAGEDIIEVDGRRMRSRVLHHNLHSVSLVAPYVITCGPALHQLFLAQEDPLVQYWCDFVNHRVLQQTIAAAQEEAKRLLGGEELSAMSPGSLKDWPLTAQRDVFSLLGDVQGLIGVTLTDSCLMVPFKSVSGLYFIGKEHFASCSLCPRVTCPNRREPYDEHKAQEIGIA